MPNNRKGIILAGGSGTRLTPITSAVSKQLLPVYDKPMIYYPLCTLMSGGIREILIITKSIDKSAFKNLLGDGSSFGIEIIYKVQDNPGGIAEAFLIGEDFIKNSNTALILGDNLFHGDSLKLKMKNASKRNEGATIFAYPVNDPKRYGVVEFDKEGVAVEIAEKPNNPKSNLAVTGLYFYDSSVVDKAKSLSPSKRGELEITDLNMLYMKEKQLKVESMDSGMAWLDTGTFDSLFEASGYIYTLQKRQGLKIGCPEEIAWRNKWITTEKLEEISKDIKNMDYSNYLNKLFKNEIY